MTRQRSTLEYQKLKRLQKVSAVTLAVLIFLLAIVAFFWIACMVVDRDARVLPSYERVDLGPIFDKPREEWSDEDVQTLCYQTGILSREALLEQSNGKLLEFQNALFFEGELGHDENVAWTTPHDILYDPETGKLFSAPMVNLQPGDILITSSCHTYGWRGGHAALVLGKELILQSYALGTNSGATSIYNEYNGKPWFQEAANFMVLRLKDADAQARREIADRAEKFLAGVPYDLSVGVFKKKDQGTAPKGTHCSHLVWQAYKYAGYDIDSDGGPVCTPRDIANSPYLEVVQIYGFDPVKGW